MRTQKRQIRELRKSIALLLVLLLVIGSSMVTFSASQCYIAVVADRPELNNWGQQMTATFTLNGSTTEHTVTFDVYQNADGSGNNTITFESTLPITEILIIHNGNKELEIKENEITNPYGAEQFFENNHPSFQIKSIEFRSCSEILEYTLNLESNPTTGGTTSGEGSYVEGQSVNVSATPNQGYEFINWTDEDDQEVSDDANFPYTMPGEDVTLTANFAPLYTLSLQSNPAAGGSTSGEGSFKQGNEANVSATANEGFTFVNWTDEDDQEVSDVANFPYTMPGKDITLTANFMQLPDTYTVTLESNPENVGTLTGAGAYLEDATVSIAATNYDGYKFINWIVKGGSEVSNSDSFSHTMLADDVTFVANFVPIYELTLEADPEGGGTVSDGDFYEAGEKVNLMAEANDGYRFINWTDEDDSEVSGDASFEYTMPENDVTLTANFEAIYELTLESNPEAGGATSGEGLYSEGEVVELTAEANQGFTFVNWTDEDEVELSTETTFDYTMPGQDITLTANFDPDPELFVLTLRSNPTDGGSTTGAGAYLIGTKVNISAVAAEGYDFVDWTDEDDQFISSSANFIYDMPDENVTLTANFDEAGENGGGGNGGGGGDSEPTGGGGGGTPASTPTLFTVPTELTPLGAPIPEDVPEIVLEQPIPLAPPELPKTGDSNPLHFMLAGLFLTAVGFIFRKRVTE